MMNRRDTMSAKVKLAQRDDTRVLIVRTPATHDMLSMMSYADKALEKLQSARASETNVSALQGWARLMDLVEAEARKLCAEANITYDYQRRIN